MMKSNRANWQFILTPLSWLYAMITTTRNFLFDSKFFISTSFDIPVISIGNLTVGGTGKTPHTEYMIDLLDDYKLAVLSRGYKRTSKGFVLADDTSSSLDIGDEPRQIKSKFPDLAVAVDGDRKRGIKQLINIIEGLNAILLDDAYQHRWVKPSLSILLMDYNRPIYEDSIMPRGNLRESISGIRRANIIIVSKTPCDIKPIDKRIILNNLKLYPYQKLFFSTLKYGSLKSVFGNNRSISQSEFNKGAYGVVLLTGIASPQPLVNHLNQFSEKVVHLDHPDHYTYKLEDVQRAYDEMEGLGFSKRMIVTTEKDAKRMLDMNDFPENIKTHFYYLPIEIEFLEGQESFNGTVMNLLKRFTPISKVENTN